MYLIMWKKSEDLVHGFNFIVTFSIRSGASPLQPANKFAKCLQLLPAVAITCVYFNSFACNLLYAIEPTNPRYFFSLLPKYAQTTASYLILFVVEYYHTVIGFFIFNWTFLSTIFYLIAILNSLSYLRAKIKFTNGMTAIRGTDSTSLKIAESRKLYTQLLIFNTYVQSCWFELLKLGFPGITLHGTNLLPQSWAGLRRFTETR
ncbi:unnamed protein product [Allacma fusca]|uniref:Uncharacterized protein n=1 Tax=Allacma fusca TaxID=39272 RepID=A0A8J2P6T1_9HEXA|nr:unnamed protein product [Allacma fusca]